MFTSLLPECPSFCSCDKAHDQKQPREEKISPQYLAQPDHTQSLRKVRTGTEAGGDKELEECCRLACGLRTTQDTLSKESTARAGLDPPTAARNRNMCHRDATGPSDRSSSVAEFPSPR